MVQQLVLELGSDENGFVVEGLRILEVGADPLTTSTLIDAGVSADNQPAQVTVNTGSQWGPYEVVAEHHATPSGPLADTWEDTIELSVTCDGYVSVGEIVDGPVGSIDVTPGTYRLRLSSRGRTESAARDATVDDESDEDLVAIEHYLLEIWPAPPAPAEVRERSQFAKHGGEPQQPDWPAERGPALAAARAILRDVRHEPGARTLTGHLADVTAEGTLPGRPLRLFNRIGYAITWPFARGMAGSPGLEVGSAKWRRVPGSGGV